MGASLQLKLSRGRPTGKRSDEPPRDRADARDDGMRVRGRPNPIARETAGRRRHAVLAGRCLEYRGGPRRDRNPNHRGVYVNEPISLIQISPSSLVSDDR
jgi:hypothetical protein